MKGNLQRRHTMQRLHVYTDDKVPDDIMSNVTNQLKQLRPVPVRLDHIDPQVIQQFPRIVKFPADYMEKEM